MLVYNFKTKGYDGPLTNTLYDGNIKKVNGFGDSYEYSLYDNPPLEKNDYNYYELPIDLGKLKIKGTSLSYKLIESAFASVGLI
jgi:hypothetical protein